MDGDIFERIVTRDQAFAEIDLNMALLNQTCANTARAKTLGVQNILQLHGPIVNAPVQRRSSAHAKSVSHQQH
jgi:hypothetical protein